MATTFSIILNENVWILIKISVKFVPKDPIDNITALAGLHELISEFKHMKNAMAPFSIL